MSFVRQPILKPEIEKQLWKDLIPLWENEKLTANDIAYKLEFGEEDTRYEKLKPYHVYFYRRKAILLSRKKEYTWLKELIGDSFAPRRNREEGGSRYKVLPANLLPLTKDEFTTNLDKKLPAISDVARRERSYLILHYWTPLRKSEIYERTYDSFTIEKDYLVIHLLRKKKLHPKTVTDEPFDVPLGLPKINEVVEWLKGREWYDVNRNPENRPWNISASTALIWVKEVFPNYYPHYFRFQWITEACDDEKTTITDLKSDTGLNAITIDKYILASKKYRRRYGKRVMEKYDVKPSTEKIILPKLPKRVLEEEHKKVEIEKEEEKKIDEFEKTTIAKLEKIVSKYKKE